MNLQEAQAKLTKTEINDGQLWSLNSLYLLLNLNKDDFCKIIDAVGIESLSVNKSHYDQLLQSECELSKKERYLRAKTRLEELEIEKSSLDKFVNEYKAALNEK